MSKQFVTLKKVDPKFRELLHGGIVPQSIALPVRQFSLKPNNDELTFQIIPLSELQRPALFKILFYSLRIRQLTFIFAPLICALIPAVSLWQPLPWVDLTLVVLSLIFLYWSILMMNDYFGHITLSDQADKLGGSRIIQRGWLKARQVRSISLVNLVFAIGLASPLIIKKMSQHLQLLYVVALLVIFLFVLPRKLKRIGVNDLLVFLLSGPLLVYGFGAVLQLRVSTIAYVSAIFLGYLTAVILQVRQFERLAVDAPQSDESFVGFLGFDRAKLLLKCQFIFLAIFYVLIVYLIGWDTQREMLTNYFVIAACCLSVIAVWRLWRSLAQLGGPISSPIVEIKMSLLNIHFLAACSICSFLLLADYFVSPY